MRFPRLNRIDLGIAAVNVVWDTKVADMRKLAQCGRGYLTPLGLWDGDNNTIYILRGLSKKAQARILFHEMIHAMVDYYEAAVQARARDL